MLDLWTNERCTNTDELTLELDKNIKDLPSQLIWSKIYNRRRYCYFLLDIYQTLKNGGTRDPHNVPITEEEAIEIERRVELLESTFRNTMCCSSL